MMMTRIRLMFSPLMPLAAALALLTPALAQAQQPPPPQKIDVSRFKKDVNEVVVPVPSEIFNALDKLDSSLNWSGQVAPDSRPHLSKPEEIAMLLGTVIANGFIAVEAKQADKVQEIGRRVIELAGALGVRDAVLKHCNAIIDASKNGDWLGVRSELDKAQSSVRQAMEGLKSQDESELVSIAGWLRGTQALSSLISKDYKPERAELLHQPDMLSTFENQFKRMHDGTQKNHKLMELREGLQKIKPLILESGDTPIPQKSVEEINQITTGLVKTIAP